MRDIRWLVGFVRPYWRQAALALLTLTTLVGLDLAIPRLIQRIVDQGIARGDQSVVIQTALAMLGISAVSTLIAIGNNNFSIRAGEGTARDLRAALFTKIQSFSFGNLDRQKTGLLLVRLTSDVAAVKSLTQITLRIGTRAPLLMIGSIVLMFVTSPRLALAMLPLLAITVGLIIYFVVRTEPLFRTVQRRLDALNEVLQENVAGARLVKALVRAEAEEKRFERTNVDLTQQSTSVMQRLSTMTPALTMCINIGLVVVIRVGGLESIRGELTTGQLVAFTNYLLTTMTPLVMMTLLSNTWASGLASLRRMREIESVTPDIVDPSHPIPPGPDPNVGLDAVTFRYTSGDDVLTDITLEASPGKTIAILGGTGAGKSTLVNLIPRFYDATTGTVSAFGHDVREYEQAKLVRRVGYVPQEALLFSGTVRDNIRYGRPDATPEEVERAARAAQAHEFIAKLPNGYDSKIEQRGQNLSGGQKQRISIARALLVEPSILILDDATSAVDVETETKIQKALAEHGTRTTFVVAQRISTVLDADVIIVLEKGRIVARGTHRELLDASPIYREIYDSQLGAS